MSGSHAESNNQERERTNVPRAIVHKKILDAAASLPDASMEEVAAEVSGASIGLVEKVLDEYGDPAEGETGADVPPPGDPAGDERPAFDGASDSDVDRDGRPDDDPSMEPAHLTEKQLETLEAIYRHPEATQAELGDRLGISDATVCQRVNAIAGFEWDSRREFVNAMFENGDESAAVEVSNDGSPDDLVDHLDELSQRIESLTETLEGRTVDPSPAVDDPKLLQKVLHVCLRSETISEDEELRLIEWLVCGGTETGR